MMYSKSYPHLDEKNISRAYMSSPIGRVAIEATEGKIISVGRAQTIRIQPKIRPVDKKILQQAEKELKEYFSGKRKSFSLNLMPVGTEFQKKVWLEMAKIPYGKTMSYAALAEKVGSPDGARAIGQACNKNPYLIVVPCHRVVASNGHLGGFALGLPAKETLLALENKSY